MTPLVRKSSSEIDVFRSFLRYVPVGSIIHGAYSSIPSGFLVCDGSLLSTTTYASLYGICGVSFGSGAGTFGIPNTLGRFISASTTSIGTALTSSTTKIDSSWALGTLADTHSHSTNWGTSSAVSNAHTHTLTGGDTYTRPVGIQLPMIIKRYSRSTFSPLSGSLVRGSSSWMDYYQRAISSGVGTIAFHSNLTPPTNWLLCDGSVLNTTTDAELFSVIGYTYGGSGNSFYLPNCASNNYHLGGVLTGAGVLSSCVTGMPVASVTGAHSAHSHSYYNTATAYTTTCSTSGSYYRYSSITGYLPYSGTTTHTHTLSGGDTETRPDNVYCNYLIRYE